jgi:hypothetical protein
MATVMETDISSYLLLDFLFCNHSYVPNAKSVISRWLSPFRSLRKSSSTQVYFPASSKRCHIYYWTLTLCWRQLVITKPALVAQIAPPADRLIDFDAMQTGRACSVQNIRFAAIFMQVYQPVVFDPSLKGTFP